MSSSTLSNAALLIENFEDKIEFWKGRAGRVSFQQVELEVSVFAQLYLECIRRRRGGAASLKS